MIKSVTMVSDTDSTIISLDAWYRFVLNHINGEELRIANYCPDPILFIEKDDDGNWTDKPWERAITFEPKQYDYNFATEEIIECERWSHPEQLTDNDNVRYSIISIIGFILDNTVNDYMIKACENINSIKEPYHSSKECRIYAKNEFLFKRLMMTMVKKNYASLIEVQEGIIVPKNKQLDVKGIEALTKSTKSKTIRDNLQKILLEDILKAPNVDQLKFIKDIAILEKRIVESVRNGNNEYFKPATIKSKSQYENPMRIQGIKASIAWNMIKPAQENAIDLDTRNAINIVKVQIDRSTADRIKDKYPEVYNNILTALDDEAFKTYVKNPKTGEKRVSANEITTVAMPFDTTLPDWLDPFIDYNSIITDNLGGFPYESIGIERLDKSINYTNIVEL